MMCLSIEKWLKWLLFTSLATTQFIGLGFMMVALIGILRERGATLEDLSLVYLIGIPSIIKFTWAPLVDRYGSKRLGHYRGWLLAMQLVMILLLLYLSQLSLDSQLPLIATVGFILAFFTATQDIAADALASREFDRHERGLLNGIRMAGASLGQVLGGGVILILYPYIGWAGAFYLLAGITAITWFQLLFFRESEYISQGELPSVRQNFIKLVKFWHKKGQWLLVVCSLPMGFSLVYGILTPLILDAGKTLADVGMMMNIVGMTLGVLAGLLSGLLIQRLGRKRALIGFALLQLLGYTIISPVAWVTNNWTIYFAVIVYFVTYAFISSIMTTIMMDYAARSKTPGTDFVAQFSINLFIGMFAAGVSLRLAQHVGYGVVMIIAIILSALAASFTIIYSKQLVKENKQLNSL